LRTPGNVARVFPPELYESLLAESTPFSKSLEAINTYEAAAQKCRSDVQIIVKECERTNSKFSDPEFDIDKDFSTHDYNCLSGIMKPFKNGDEFTKPGSVHRIPWIFETPQFVTHGFASDIKQGASKNCWWLAALAAVSRRTELLEKICVARDEECGVYGFVFYRDGEWISTVVDDNLYLTEEDFNQDVHDSTGKRARAYRKQKQTGSDSLFFAKCGSANETWLPLLEKAVSALEHIATTANST
jgi:hypothetical protein